MELCNKQVWKCKILKKPELIIEHFMRLFDAQFERRSQPLKKGIYYTHSGSYLIKKNYNKIITHLILFTTDVGRIFVQALLGGWGLPPILFRRY